MAVGLHVYDVIRFGLGAYVGPMNVSFHGIMVSEIPYVHTNMPSGFFATTNYTGQWTHWRIFDGESKGRSLLIQHC